MAKKGGNPQNLISTATLTPEERRERGAKGGKKKAENERKRKAMREQLELLLQLPVQSIKGVNALLKNGVTDPELSDNQAAMMAVAINKAMEGNIEYFEFIRDTIGEKPANNFAMEATVKSIPEDDRRLMERVEKRLKAEQKVKTGESSG